MVQLAQYQKILCKHPIDRNNQQSQSTVVSKNNNNGQQDKVCLQVQSQYFYLGINHHCVIGLRVQSIGEIPIVKSWSTISVQRGHTSELNYKTLLHPQINVALTPFQRIFSLQQMVTINTKPTTDYNAEIKGSWGSQLQKYIYIQIDSYT